MARYLITGIAGFIGSSLAHALVKQGHEVSGFDNLSTGNLENLADIRSSVQFQEMDLQDKMASSDACKGIDFILHQGALASVPRSVKDPLTSHESNINGTLNLLLAARRCQGASHRLCSLILRLWRSAHAAQTGRDAADAALSLCGAEAYL